MSSSDNNDVEFRSNRRVERTAVSLRASVTTMTSYEFPELLNISTAGAKFRGGVQPSLGATCMFRLDGVELLCKVVWRTGIQYGVRFEEPLASAALARIRQSGGVAAVGIVGRNKARHKMP